MRRCLYLLGAVLIFLLLGGVVAWRLLQSDFFWRWGGPRLVHLAQESLEGEIKVREVKGNPLTGLNFHGLTVRGPQGEVLRAERLEVRFSLWSCVQLQPVIARLALSRPHLTLRQDEHGHWEVSKLLRPGGAGVPLRKLEFPQIEVKGGAIDLLRPHGRQHFSDLNLGLALTVLHPQQPRQSLRVPRAHLDLTTPYGRFALDSRFAFSQGRLALESLVVATQGRPLLAVSGEVGLGAVEPGINLKGEVGPLTGGELQGLWAGWPSAWDLAGTWQLSGTTAQLQVAADGQWHRAKYSFKGQVGRISGEWHYDLTLHLAGLPPELLAAFSPAWEQKVKDLEPLTVRLGLKGASLGWPPRKMEWTLECEPFQYQRARLEQLKLTLSGDAQAQRLEGNIQGNFGQVNLASQGPLLTSQTGELKVQADGVKPDLWGLPALEGSSLTGKFAGNFRLTATLWLTGEAEATGQLAQQPLKELRSRLTWDGTRLEIPQARILLGALAAELKGSLEEKGLDLQYRGHLTADGSWALLPASVRGRVEGEGVLKGPWSSPQYSLTGKGQGLFGEGFGVDSLGIKAEGAGWLPHSGRLELQGTGLTTPVVGFTRGNLTCQGEGGRWRFKFNASSSLGQAEIAGGADLNTSPLSLLVEHYRFKYLVFSAASTSPMQIRLFPGWEISPAHFQINEAQLKLQGLARDGKLAGRLELKDLPADLLPLQGLSLKGKLGGQLTLSGDPQQPAVQGQITWGPGQLGNFSFSTCTTSLDYRDGRLHLKGSLEESTPGPRLTWEGQVPLNLTFQPFKWSLGERDLNFRLQGEQANLALLTALSPDIQEAEGALDIMAEWQGDPKRPRVAGQVRWGSGFLNFRQAGLPYRLAPGQARLEGDRIQIPEITLESGGKARLTGEVTLAGFRPQQVEARAQLQDFVALRRDGSEAAGSGTLSLTGPWSAPLLKGQLLVTRAYFRPGFFQPEKHEDLVLVRAKPPAEAKGPAPGPAPFTFYRDLKMEVALEAPGGVWLKDKSLNVELAGRLKASKRSGDRAYVGGEVHTVKGTYELQGRNFKVERGIIRLPGVPREDVTIEGRATHEMEGLTLILTATGLAGKPQVRLESIPPLPSSDLLAYLVFGRPAQRLSREEYLNMGQKAAGILGGLTAEKVKDMLGKDFPLVGDVTLRTSQPGERQAVGVAKPLTKDLTVSFERKFDALHRDNTEQVLLEYKVNRYLSVESQVGRRNSGADVLFNLDF